MRDAVLTRILSTRGDFTPTAENVIGVEGLSESALVEKAVSDYLFIRRFRNLRERLMSQRKNLTDQDVFYLVPGH